MIPRIKRTVPVSIIVPSLATLEEITPLIVSLYNSTVWANQLIIVDVGQRIHQVSVFPDFISPRFLAHMTIVQSDTILYPGEARNKGLTYAKFDFIAFLDVHTLPDPLWMQSAFSLIKDSDSGIVHGLTKYVTDSRFQQLVIDSTYGRDPIKTIPGSMITTMFFNRIGNFLPNIRSGEDTDWLIRCSQFFAGSRVNSVPLIYNKVPRSYTQLFLKWYRNYSSCAAICFHLQYQRFVYVSTLCTCLILIAYNWNSVIASWDFNNPFYAHNITKIVAMILVFLYSLIRGLYMPFSRGVPLRCLLPLRFFRLAVICLVIDSAKVGAFLLTRAPAFPLGNYLQLFSKRIFSSRK